MLFLRFKKKSVNFFLLIKEVFQDFPPRFNDLALTLKINSNLEPRNFEVGVAYHKAFDQNILQKIDDDKIVFNCIVIRNIPVCFIFRQNRLI